MSARLILVDVGGLTDLDGRHCDRGVGLSLGEWDRRVDILLVWLEALDTGWKCGPWGSGLVEFVGRRALIRFRTT
jgi:hypothetical protein